MSRLASFLQNVDTLATVMPGKLEAATYILHSKLNHDAVANGAYKGQPFIFRRDDIPAVREVLEKQEYSVLTPHITASESPLILDIGAHIGTTSLWILGVNPKARILSVEANTGNYNWLQKNHHAAQSRYQNWKIIYGAAWKDRDGVSFISDGPTMSRRVGGQSAEKVPTHTFPDLINLIAPQNEMIDLAKIDIEGAEEAFICAHPECLKRLKAVVIELHPNLCDTERVLDALKAVFNTIKPVHDRKSSKPLLICTNE